jgi:hypothetical protein
MDDTALRSLDEVRAIVAARTFMDDALRKAVKECIAADVDRSMLAHLLGVDRSTLYRRYVWADAQAGQTCGGDTAG